MRSSMGRILGRVLGMLLVVATSFFVTMKLLDYWLTPPDPNANVIHVVAGTYGDVCKNFVPEPGKTNTVKFGNVTAALASACDKAEAACEFKVVVEQLGDPADGCDKDFIANWTCGNDQNAHRFYLPGEANGHSVLLICPAP
jgi:hypothetical protein